MTKRRVERHLDELERHVPRTRWLPYATIAGGLVLGFVASRFSILRLAALGIRAVETGLAVTGAVTGTAAVIDRFLAEHDRRLAS